MSTDAADPAFATNVDDALAAFARRKAQAFDALGPDIADLIAVADEFVHGGKRLRPRFSYAGWLIAGGDPADQSFVQAAAALEWLQASALVHDDLMDASDTRRGRPSVHRRYESMHLDQGRDGDAASFGQSAAVLLGDLLLSWCDEMLTDAILASPVLRPHLDRARTFLDLCKTEVVAGQFLDVAAQTRAALTAEQAMTVVRFKSAKYTVERPLHIGAALAGADDAMIHALSAVALPLGEAFQLRDDVLGVFGDPAITGKPAGDDLREGKRTLLIARTQELAGEAGRALLAQHLGTADGVETIASLIRDCGALDAVEGDIERLEAEADQAIDALGPGARQILGPLARTTTRRTR